MVLMGYMVVLSLSCVNTSTLQASIVNELCTLMHQILSSLVQGFVRTKVYKCGECLPVTKINGALRLSWFLGTDWIFQVLQQ